METRVATVGLQGSSPSIIALLMLAGWIYLPAHTSGWPRHIPVGRTWGVHDCLPVDFDIRAAHNSICPQARLTLSTLWYLGGQIDLGGNPCCS
ncbi:hypothetical protein B0T22DRAFT_26837 [Podospora appendiculata]|uniref:Uncharacterized protein n=1 Tax=Podospora appendiculata TaxID=314037 RepID=A0AAE1CFT5_9PEZI|nr:hypothetical protein B0T22DRAFT_26837 [Podospora appendiculata]